MRNPAVELTKRLSRRGGGHHRDTCFSPLYEERGVRGDLRVQLPFSGAGGDGEVESLGTGLVGGGGGV